LKLNKSKIISTIAFVFLLLISTFVAIIPDAKAADVTTYPYLAVSPNPVGVDQQVTIQAWVQPLPPTGQFVYHGLTITITKPDGTIQTIGPLDTSTIASQYTIYTPTMVGTYSVQMSYAGETFPTGATHLPSETPISEFVVQEEPILHWPENQIPTDYWERPINARNRYWGDIAGNWLQRGYNSTYQIAGHSDAAQSFNPYSQAPRSAHIMWTKELALGGLVGGEFDQYAYYAGHTYEEKLTPPVVMNGKIYRRIYPSDFGIGQGVGGSYPGTVCEDLRTGEVLWINNDIHVDQGQIYNFESPNQAGAIPYLWDLGTGAAFSMFATPPLFPRPRYKMYDANTGELVVTFENVTAVPFHGYSMTMYDEDGTLLIYTLIGPANIMQLWNSTKALEGAGLIIAPTAILLDTNFIRNFRGTFDWSLGIEWVKPIPDRSVMGPTGPVWPVVQGITGNVIVANVETTAETWSQIGYDATTGEELWVHDAPTWFFRSAFGEGVYASWSFNTMQWYGFDARTGNQLWISDPADYPWGVYGFSGVIAYGKLYGINFDGSVHVYDLETGKEEFKYFSGNAGLETPYGHYPFYWGPIIADEVVFAANGEHSPTQPLYRGAKLHAFDAFTGEPIWSINGWWAIQALVDGYLISSNAEDNRMYVFGKGPSATTVTAPKVAITLGQSVIIEGTVTDQSAGQPDTACIADEDMAAWMEYLHLQNPMPTNAKGVEVSLDVIDSNGNFRNIGTTTSDLTGTFGYMWEPDIPGQYTVIATFAGSESYGSSYAQTYMGVVEAPQPTPPPEPTPAPMTDTYVLGMGATAIIVIIAIGLVLILMMRKK
jgi:hypothetical protein